MSFDQMNGARRTHFSTEITPSLHGLEIVVAGHVNRIRDIGKVKFIELRDRDGQLQITVLSEKIGKEMLLKVKQIGNEFVVMVRGVVNANPKAPRGVEVLPSDIKILNSARYPLPLDPTGAVPADIDTRLNARVLDLRRPKPHAIFKMQHVLLQSIRRFLSSKGFIEIDTPKLIISATEGGTQLFPVRYFEKTCYLRQSAQLYKEQLSSAFDKVFEIGPVFRAEEHDTTRHLNELTQIDIEAAFMDYDDVMKILEQMIIESLKEVTTSCSQEFATLEKKINLPTTPFKRVTYTQLVDELESLDMEIEWGQDLELQHLKAISGKISEFFFIKEWPTKLKPFYIRPKKGDESVSESFDLQFGWLELASGGTRIHEEELLVDRLREQGLKTTNFKDHLRAFEVGMPPHAGWAVGLARLLMAITGAENIRECVLYPRDRERLTP
ncbi:MAG: aspartate--tRNA(Asn) ligase [Candidatus Atabeyarchaeum deiterrae]